MRSQLQPGKAKIVGRLKKMAQTVGRLRKNQVLHFFVTRLIYTISLRGKTSEIRLEFATILDVFCLLFMCV